MAIKILITLEGSEEVKSSLNEMAKSGEAFMQQFQGLSAKAPFAELTSDLERAKPAIESGTQVSHGFAESLRVVIPALRLAGVEVGNFAGFSRLASAGLTGLAAAITGAVIVAFANLEEQAKKTKAGLTGLFGSREVGGLAFSLLEQSAKELGISVESLAPAFQSATTAFNRFQQTAQKFKFVAINPKDLPIGNIEKTAEAVANLFKIIRAGGQDEVEASKSAQAFFNALKEGGKLTTQVLDQLPEGAIRLLGEALGKGALNVEQLRVELALTPPSITKVIEALARFGPQAKAAFDTDAIKGFRDELNKVTREFSDQFRDLVGINFSDFVIGEIKAIADGIRTSIEEFKRIRDLITRTQPAADVREKAIAEAEKLKSVKPFKWSDIFNREEAQQELEQLGADNEQASQLAAQSWDKVSESIKTMADSAVIAGQQMLEQWQKTKTQIYGSPISTQKWLTPPGAEPFTPPTFQPIAPSPTPPTQLQLDTKTLVAPFAEADNEIRQIWVDLMDYIATALNDVDLSQLTGDLVAPFAGLLANARYIFSQIAQMIQQVVRDALSAQQIIQNMTTIRPFSGQGGFMEVATGGYIRGPGTTTSDSIPAWLSNREYVIQARAVDHYGANLFAALNSMRLPKDLFGSFAMGGLAKALSNAMPRYASGGVATATTSSGRSLTIVLDGQRFGLNGSTDVIDKLERVATMAGIAYIGRPPGWVR